MCYTPNATKSDVSPMLTGQKVERGRMAPQACQLVFALCISLAVLHEEEHYTKEKQQCASIVILPQLKVWICKTNFLFLFGCVSSGCPIKIKSNIFFAISSMRPHYSKRGILINIGVLEYRLIHSIPPIFTEANPAISPPPPLNRFTGF